MARTNQGGAVLGFVVVAIIMAGLLLGGVFVVRQLTTVPQQGLQSPEDTKKDASNDQKKPAASSPEKKDTAKTTTPKSESKTPSSPQTNELPKTGPESLVGTVLMLGILTVVAVSYGRSRRLSPAL